MKKVLLALAALVMAGVLLFGACTVVTVSVVSDVAALPTRIATSMLSNVPGLGSMLTDLFGLSDDDKPTTLDEIAGDDERLRECLIVPRAISSASPRYVAAGTTVATPSPTTSSRTPAASSTAPRTSAPSSTSPRGSSERESSQPALVPTGTPITDEKGYATDVADKISAEIPTGTRYGTARTFAIVALAGGTSSWGHFSRVVADMGRGEVVTLTTAAQQNEVAKAFFEEGADLSPVYLVAGSILSARVNDETVAASGDDEEQIAQDIIGKC